MDELKKSLKAFILFSVILGLVYPVFVTVVAKSVIPHKANGCLIIRNNEIVGSELIGQYFSESKYFQSRPSAVDYNASGSGASNLGPSNSILMEQVVKRIKEIRNKNQIGNQPLPADMLLSSGSGLDPHISLQNALIQSVRISKIRKISLGEIKKLIDKNTKNDFIGIWGCQGVNILELNIDLDDISMKYSKN